MPGRDAGFWIGSEYEVTYGYDGKGRLETVTVPGLPPQQVTYTYATNSDLVEKAELSIGSVVASWEREYELHRDLIKAVENYMGSDPGESISRYQYGYDALGRRTSVFNSGAAFAQSEFNVWHHNDRSELTESRRGIGGTVEDPPTNEITAQRRAYAYDAIGNRDTHTTWPQGTATTLYYCTNPLNQYTSTDAEDDCPVPVTESFVHDADGNLKQDNQYAYEWDAENRLIEVATRRDLGQNPSGYDAGDKQLKFVYDYLGRRVEKTYATYSGSGWTVQLTQRFVYDGWNMVMLLNSSGSPLWKYTWGLDLSGLSSPNRDREGAEGIHGAGGIGGLVLAEIAVGGRYWYAYDANGNVGQLFDVTDPEELGLAARYEYDPYGNQIVADPYPQTNPFRFSTKWLDADLPANPLYYYGYRYYSPRLGRWLSRDPIGEEDSLNLYGFLANAPTNKADPDGRYIIAVGGAGGIGDAGLRVTVDAMRRAELMRYEDVTVSKCPRAPGAVVFISNPTSTFLGMFPDWSGAVSKLTRAVESYSDYYFNVMEAEGSAADPDSCVCPEFLHIVGFSDGATTIAHWLKQGAPGRTHGTTGLIGVIGLIDLVRKGRPYGSDWPNLTRGATFDAPVEYAKYNVAIRNYDPSFLTPWAGYFLEPEGWRNFWFGTGRSHAAFAGDWVVWSTLMGATAEATGELLEHDDCEWCQPRDWGQ